VTPSKPNLITSSLKQPHTKKNKQVYSKLYQMGLIGTVISVFSQNIKEKRQNERKSSTLDCKVIFKLTSFIEKVSEIWKLLWKLSF